MGTLRRLEAISGSMLRSALLHLLITDDVFRTRTFESEMRGDVKAHPHTHTRVRTDLRGDLSGQLRAASTAYLH